ncbi:MAG: cupin domain-containing protein [Gemmatimonadota bacterium]|jgi:anti-sigma factor ChrR (cupin superfamily)
MPEITLDTNQMGWVETSSYPNGTLIKVLRDEGEVRSILLKLPPGFRMGAHSHTCYEQHLVLEGEYEAAGQVLSPGTYRCIPPHTDHGPFTSRDGATVLVIWS